MAKQITISGEKAPKRAQLVDGTGWRLMRTKGKKYVFFGELRHTIRVGKKLVAVFTVNK